MESRAFSLLETLIYFMILAILALSIIKPQISGTLGIRAASSHIQRLQKTINDYVYNAHLQKRLVDKNAILSLINNAQENNRFFTLTLRNNALFLTINKERLRLNVRENANGSFSITCNPNQTLCRKLYHRTQTK